MSVRIYIHMFICNYIMNHVKSMFTQVMYDMDVLYVMYVMYVVSCGIKWPPVSPNWHPNSRI